jgi:hypothetical protein
MLGHGRRRGRLGSLQVGVSILVPKPYTPFQHQPMLDAAEARRRAQLLRAALRGVSNVRVSLPSYGHAAWQGLLSRGTCDAFAALEAAAAGAPISRVLADHRRQVGDATTAPTPVSPPWSFISSAPRRPSPAAGSLPQS